MPAGQVPQLLAPARENQPAAQLGQLADPVAAAAVPAPQLRQKLAAAAEYVPTAQAKHDTPLEYVPAAQSEQEGAPEAA